MRRVPAHVWLLCLLLPATLAGGCWVLREGDGPYDEQATIGFSVVQERPAPYTRLPEYDPGMHSFRAFPGSYRQGKVGLFSYCVWDDPYWPDGDPGRGTENPLPPQIRRHRIYGVEPLVVLVALAIGWTAWTPLFIRHLLRRQRTARGFDVLDSQTRQAG